MSIPSSTPSTRFLLSLRRNLHREHATALAACLDCGQCGSACAWYLATGDRRHHPKHRTDFLRRIHRRHLRPWSRFFERIGLTAPLSEEELREAMPAFWQCTTCGRCTLACPMGLANRRLVRLARRAFVDSGIAQELPPLRQVLEGSRDQRHSFAISRERTHLRLGFLLAANDTLVPIDAFDCEYLFVCSAVGNTRFPDLGVQVPRLLNAAGASYTLSSRITDTGTDAEFVIVHEELSREMLLEVEAEALRLRAKTLLIAECGCDVRTFHQDAGRTLGRPLRVGVRTLDSLLLESIRAGRLPVEPVAGRVTLHDPCKISRLSGLSDLAREILALVAAEFVEMEPNRERNYCCNGGTGVLRLPQNDALRRQVSSIKAAQIRATEAERVVTPCAVCMLTLADVCCAHMLAPAERRMSFLLFEIVHEAAMAAMHRRGEEARTRTPAVFRDLPPEAIPAVGMEAIIRAILASPQADEHLEWLSQDPFIVAAPDRFPESGNLLASWRAIASGAKDTR